MPNSQPQVLIIGAGPTGLALANLLASHNISFRIIDKNSQRSTESKALGVQAGSLEAINYHLGQALTEQLLAGGNPVYEAHFHFYNKTVVTLNLSLIPSIYNFILILPQSETERIFEERLTNLNLSVERETELISLNQNSAKVSALIKTKHGEEKVEADFIVGCDGAHSTVRHQLNLGFAGSEYTGNFILGDIKAEALNQTNALQIFISEQGGLAYFPIQVNGIGRLILIPKNLTTSDRTDISLDEFNTLANELAPYPIAITEATWLTRFSIHHCIANHFRQGRAFLAGDAAHIHSPAGGQGMNTGIQDAFNLGFKLKQVLQGQAKYSLLDTYEKERYPVAKKILQSTDFASRHLLLSNSWFTQCTKKYLLPHVLKLNWVQKKLATAISEIHIARKEIASREARE